MMIPRRPTEIVDGKDTAVPRGGRAVGPGGVRGKSGGAPDPGSSIAAIDNLLVAAMKGDGGRGSRGGELGRVEGSSAPGRGDRIGPALGDPAQAVAGPAGGSVPGHGGLRPGVSPRRDRGGPARLRGVPRDSRRWWSGPTSTSSTCCLASGSGSIRSRWPVRRASRSTAPCRWPTISRSWRSWSSWSSRAGSSFMPEFARRCYPATLRLKELLATHAGTAPAGARTFAALRIRPLRDPGPDHPDRPGAAVDRPGQLPARLVWLRLPVAARGRAGHAVPGHPRRRPWRRRSRTSRASWPTFAGARRPRSRSADTIGRCWGDASRFLPPPGLPGLRRARGRLPGDARADPVVRRRAGSRTNGSPWSRPSATCSTTSSIAWSAAIIRWRRRSGTPWPSPGWSATSGAARSKGEPSFDLHRRSTHRCGKDAQPMGSASDATGRGLDGRDRAGGTGAAGRPRGGHGRGTDVRLALAELGHLR